MPTTYTKSISQRLANTRIRNLLGATFGRLLVVQYAGKSKRGKVLWLCVCKCGEITAPQGSGLVAGKVRSCGCLNREKFLERITKHGHTSKTEKPTPEYRAFNSAKQRCVQPNHKWYPHYGARGIKFEFESFEQFLDSLGYRPSPEHSLDRIDNDGPYSPKNCRWATRAEQNLNRRNTVLLTIDGKTRSIYEWSELTGLAHRTIRSRKKYGWCDRCCVFSEHRQRCSHIGRTKRGLWRLDQKTPQD